MMKLPRDTRIAIGALILILIILGFIAYFGYPNWSTLED